VCRRRAASRIPGEAAQVKRTVREYLAELEQQNVTAEPVPQQERISTTDPGATYVTKGGPAALGYYDNYLVDNHNTHSLFTPAMLAEMRLRAFSSLKPRRTILFPSIVPKKRHSC
jgi:hypothetical protein